MGFRDLASWMIKTQSGVSPHCKVFLFENLEITLCPMLDILVHPLSPHPMKSTQLKPLGLTKFEHDPTSGY